MIVRSMQLDVAQPGGQLALYARKGDKRIYTLLISLCEKSVPIEIPEDWSATWRARKPDGTVIFDKAIIEKGRIKAYLQTQALTADGIMKCEIDVYGANGEALFSPYFDIYIEKPVVEDGEIESTDDFAALTDALTTVNQMGEIVEDLVERSQEAVEECMVATDAAARAATSIDHMTVEAHGLLPDSEPTVSVDDVDGHKHITFGLVQGTPGHNFTILGQYDTLADLTAAVPTPGIGAQYYVGEQAPRNIYRWDGAEWVDDGKLQGPIGETGQAATIAIVETVTGEAGVGASLVETGDSTAQDRKYVATIPQGGQGIQGVQGIDGKTGKSAYEVAVEGGFEGTETEWLESLHGMNGLTTSVNGVGQVEGNVQVTAADIPLNKANATTVLEAFEQDNHVKVVGSGADPIIGYALSGTSTIFTKQNGTQIADSLVPSVEYVNLTPQNWADTEQWSPYFYPNSMPGVLHSGVDEGGNRYLEVVFPGGDIQPSNTIRARCDLEDGPTLSFDSSKKYYTAFSVAPVVTNANIPGEFQIGLATITAGSYGYPVAVSQGDGIGGENYITKGAIVSPVASKDEFAFVSINIVFFNDGTETVHLDSFSVRLYGMLFVDLTSATGSGNEPDYNTCFQKFSAPAAAPTYFERYFLKYPIFKKGAIRFCEESGSGLSAFSSIPIMRGFFNPANMLPASGFTIDYFQYYRIGPFVWFVTDINVVTATTAGTIKNCLSGIPRPFQFFKIPVKNATSTGTMNAFLVYDEFEDAVNVKLQSIVAITANTHIRASGLYMASNFDSV